VTNWPAAACTAGSRTRVRKRPSKPAAVEQVERTNAWHNAFNRLQRC
jgi:hypothetical protein